MLRWVVVAAVLAELITGCTSAGGSGVAGVAAIKVQPELERSAAQVGVDLHADANSAVGRVRQALRLSGALNVDLVFDDRAVIPELGIGGFTNPTTGAVTISFTSRPPGGLRHVIDTRLGPVLAHELDHTDRILHGPGYGHTLGDAIVSEGLADNFAAALYPHAAKPWARALTSTQVAALMAAARAGWYSTDTAEVHHSWFFGSAQLPRWSGYIVGDEVVSQYLRARHLTASTATLALRSSDIYNVIERTAT